MTVKQSRPMTEDDEMTSLDEIETAEWAANLPPEKIPGAIRYEWSNLQEVPSYVEEQASIFASEK